MKHWTREELDEIEQELRAYALEYGEKGEMTQSAFFAGASSVLLAFLGAHDQAEFTKIFTGLLSDAFVEKNITKH